MSREPRELRVVQLANELVLEVYRRTRGFPVEERYGLHGPASAQRRVGCAVRHLLAFSRRLEHLPREERGALDDRHDELVRPLQNLLARWRTSTGSR